MSIATITCLMRCPLPRDMSLQEIPVSRIAAANPKSVRPRSPLRYPGGKSWLIPHIRQWIQKTRPSKLIEPFAGGANVSLTAVMENLVQRCVLIEIDEDVAAFWRAALENGTALRHCVHWLNVTPERLESLERQVPSTVTEHGFRTLLLNRTRYGGILAKRATVVREGEDGKGLGSRWYPKTLASRLAKIEDHANRIEFVKGDAMELLPKLLKSASRTTAVFVDPPYTVAGERLYKHSEIDHANLFALLAKSECNFLMTLDASPDVVDLVNGHGFAAARVLVKGNRHNRVHELVITPEPFFAE